MPTPTLIYRENRYGRRVRRAVDIVLSLALLALALPLVAAACAAIWLEDGGPVFFRQRRAGRFERIFVIYKLRTMRAALCSDQESPSAADDMRVTAVGRFLRRTSIDELPQLFNVLRGDMSLIGPRPEMYVMLARYEPWQHLRHLMAPGLTGLWQTTCRATLPLERPEATAVDIDYIRRASPLLDSTLLLRTVFAVVSQKGAF